MWRRVKRISLEKLLNKGIGVILLAFVMLLSVTACGQTETSKESTAESQETEPVTMSDSGDVEAVNEVSEAITESEVGRPEGVQSKEPEQEADTMVLAINGEIVSSSSESIIRRTIGKTTYVASLHFKKQGQTFAQKLKRVLKADCNA